MPQRQQSTRRTSQTSQSLRVLYHRLGEMIARLEDAERGEIIEGQKVRHEFGAEPLLPGERSACLKARCLLVQRAWLASLQAVVDAKPQLGDDVRLVEVVRVCAFEDLDDAALTRVARTN